MSLKRLSAKSRTRPDFGTSADVPRQEKSVNLGLGTAVTSTTDQLRLIKNDAAELGGAAVWERRLGREGGAASAAPPKDQDRLAMSINARDRRAHRRARGVRG